MLIQKPKAIIFILIQEMHFSFNNISYREMHEKIHWLDRGLENHKHKSLKTIMPQYNKYEL